MKTLARGQCTAKYTSTIEKLYIFRSTQIPKFSDLISLFSVFEVLLNPLSHSSLKKYANTYNCSERKGNKNASLTFKWYSVLSRRTQRTKRSECIRKMQRTILMTIPLPRYEKRAGTKLSDQHPTTTGLPSATGKTGSKRMSAACRNKSPNLARHCRETAVMGQLPQLFSIFLV